MLLLLYLHDVGDEVKVGKICSTASNGCEGFLKEQIFEGVQVGLYQSHT